MKHSEALEREKNPQLAFPVFYEAAHYPAVVGFVSSESYRVGIHRMAGRLGR